MRYESIWWTLPEALERVMAATGETEDGVKADICRALADRAIDFLSKLDKQHPPRSMTSNAVLAGDDFEIPHGIKPEKLDWVNSRPLEPWPVRRQKYKIPGFWGLEWIKLSSLDVIKHLCGPGRQDERAQDTLSDAGAASRTQPKREGALKAIADLYPQGVPAQAAEPNALLCRRVGGWLKERGLPNVLDDTILRAAGRRK
jgi:hypothetical protein